MHFVWKFSKQLQKKVTKVLNGKKRTARITSRISEAFDGATSKIHGINDHCIHRWYYWSKHSEHGNHASYTYHKAVYHKVLPVKPMESVTSGMLYETISFTMTNLTNSGYMDVELC